QPDDFTPSPWEAYTYDPNDNAGRTHPAASAAYASHRDTPASAVVDALGRIVELTERSGPALADRHVTRSAYDAHGNVVAITDPLGRVARRTTYDFLDRPLRVEQLDGGIRRTVPDAAGNPVEERDAKGAVRLQLVDGGGRPI